jgi:hypothetical protein
MEQIEHLQKQWRDSIRFRGLHANLMLEKDGLVLGANTRLAKRTADGALDIEGCETRLLTLLSVAYGRPINTNVLQTLNRASKLARCGDDVLAAMHIALSGLPRLSDPGDASRRLFIADGLLEMGVRPLDIFTALDFDPAPLDELEKRYNANELRNPKGDGRVSGEWARDVEQAEADAKAIAESVVEQLPRVVSIATRIRAGLAAAGAAATEAAAAAVGPLVFAAAMVIPYPEPDSEGRGNVEGHPGLRYVWNRDDNTLRVQRVSDGETLIGGRLTVDGKLWDGPKLIGHKEGDKLVIDPFMYPDMGPDADQKDRPDLCPKETPDRPGRKGAKGAKDKAYEDQMKLWVNPGNPTPTGFGYAMVNLKTKQRIIFDDCQHRTGFLFDAKGTTYAEMLASHSDGLANGVARNLLTEARNQIGASQEREIYWVFAEEKAAELVRKLFDKKGNEYVKRIAIYYMPPGQVPHEVQ